MWFFVVDLFTSILKKSKNLAKKKRERERVLFTIFYVVALQSSFHVLDKYLQLLISLVFIRHGENIFVFHYWSTMRTIEIPKELTILNVKRNKIIMTMLTFHKP